MLRWTHFRFVFVTLALTACALPVDAVIPASERQVLIDLYNNTNGDGWTANANWKSGGVFGASGTECTWLGVDCDAGNTHVTLISSRWEQPQRPPPGARRIDRLRCGFSVRPTTSSPVRSPCWPG